MKKCCRCSIEKELKDFHKRKQSKDGHFSACNKCRSIAKPKEILPDGTKRCTNCKNIKELKDFGKNKVKKDGHNFWCKECVKQEYYKNIERYKRNSKIYREKNIDIILLKEKKRRQKYKEKIYLRNKEYNKKNRLKVNERQRIYQKNRTKNDPNFRLRRNIGTRIRNAISNKQLKTIKLLGCNVIFLKQYLEPNLKKGMTWENYGKVWNLDHIIPCAKFDLTDIEQQK